MATSEEIRKNVKLEPWHCDQLEEDMDGESLLYLSTDIKHDKFSRNTVRTLRAAGRPHDTLEWAKEIVEMYTNPVQPTMSGAQRDIHKCLERLVITYRGRKNGLGAAREDEVNDPRAICILLLRAEKGFDWRGRYPNPSEPRRDLAIFDTGTYGKSGLISLDRLEGRLLLKPNVRFGNDGGDLQDLWSALAFLRTSGQLDPTMQGIADAMYYAKSNHNYDHNDRKRKDD